MKIIKDDLMRAAQCGFISNDQVEKLWNFLGEQRPEQGKFQALHVLYYFGGILILASMSWFLTNVWDEGGMIMAVSGSFAAIYVLVGNRLWNQMGMKIPGGLLITAAVGLTPVFIYGFQKQMGFWPESAPTNYHDYHVFIRGNWIFMEVATVIAGLAALRFFPFTFLTFPIAFSLWYMSMDLVPILFGKDFFGIDEKKIVSILFGLVVLGFSYFLDRKNKSTDFAFWTYLFGMMAFWGGLSTLNSDSELNKFIYCILNVGFIFLSVYMRRKVFIVFGSMGVFGYLGHLAWKVFKNSLLFPVALAVLGIAIVFLGVLYQKNKKEFESYIENLMPNFLMRWRPEERA